MLTITAPASSQQLLTSEQMRLAAGLSADDASQDAALTELGLRVAAEICAYCGIAVGIGGAPTLKREGLTETFRRVDGLESLFLARRHDIVVSSVTLDGEIVAATDLEVEAEEGVLYRLLAGCQVRWFGSKVVVVYEAGFSTAPADLAGAAADLVRLRRSEAARDPLVKGSTTEIPDVITERRDYWVGSVPGTAAAGGIPEDVAGRLRRYRNGSIA